MQEEKKKQIEELKKQQKFINAKIEYLKTNKFTWIEEEFIKERIHELEAAEESVKLGIVELEFELEYEKLN